MVVCEAKHRCKCVDIVLVHCVLETVNSRSMRRVVPLSVAFVAALQLFANGFADARVIDEAVGVVKSLEEKLRGSDDRSEKPAGHNHASSDEGTISPIVQ